MNLNLLCGRWLLVLLPPPWNFTVSRKAVISLWVGRLYKICFHTEYESCISCNFIPEELRAHINALYRRTNLIIALGLPFVIYF